MTFFVSIFCVLSAQASTSQAVDDAHVVRTPAVSWRISDAFSISDIQDIKIAPDAAALVFLRENDDDENSVNIAVNGRYAGSLQAAHYFVRAVCAGHNQISLVPTNTPSNNLYHNHNTIDTQKAHIYYIKVTQSASNAPSFSHIGEDEALDLLPTFKKSVHQISRAPKQCANVNTAVDNTAINLNHAMQSNHVSAS